jgi:hypothetical protein
MICVDRTTYKLFVQACADLRAAVMDAQDTAKQLSELLLVKRRQSDAAHKAHETRERNAEFSGRTQAELNRAALDAAAPYNGPRSAEEGGGT